MQFLSTQFYLRLVLALLMILSLSGCAAVLLGGGAVAGAGAYAYKKGSQEVTLEGDIHVVYQVVQRTLEELEIHLVSSEKDALTASVVGRGAGDKKVKVKIKRIEDDLTHVSVRVGTFGNRDMSRLICDQIVENLQETG
jgi:hypothetical protein